MMKSIAVFCGSSTGTDEIYKTQARLLGQTFSKQNIILVYGGAKYGLMGTVADEVLNNGGKVIGVLPHFLKNREAAHERLSELILVDTMHERKIEMFELCDGFIALPGGFGTLDELFEIITWAQLGLHKKPIAILNINGFYDSLIGLIETLVAKGFVKEENKKMILTGSDINDLLYQMNNYIAPVDGAHITQEVI
jgi:uncharacterized protein (TIGR00730 family)